MLSRLGRRRFLGALGIGAGMGAIEGGCATASEAKPRTGGDAPACKPPAGLREDVAALVAKTPFVDTHEHLWEEKRRIEGLDDPKETNLPTADIGMLFSHYADSDLHVAGMRPVDLQRIRRPGLAPKEKWALIEPYYAAARHTGYLRNVRLSVWMLYGEQDLCEDNVEAISEKLRAGVKPGMNRRILQDVCNIEYCQVNDVSGEYLFRETAQPALLTQDISFVPLLLPSHTDIQKVGRQMDMEPGSFETWLECVDKVFAAYAPRAIAMKSQQAYSRGLDYARVEKEEAKPRFEQLLNNPGGVPAEDHVAVQDFMFHYCIEKSIEHKLPVKLHTGYYAGSGSMPLGRLAGNPGEMTNMLMAHKDARFVFMHITYPYQDAAIAAAKQHPNAWIDMCWAWIINPSASVRFLKEFLKAAPASKLFTFGGDYLPVELVPGHAAIARQGITQALCELVEEGWIDEGAVPELVERLMRGNAHEMFDYEKTQLNWG